MSIMDDEDTLEDDEISMTTTALQEKTMPASPFRVGAKVIVNVGAHQGKLGAISAIIKDDAGHDRYEVNVRSLHWYHADELQPAMKRWRIRCEGIEDHWEVIAPTRDDAKVMVSSETGIPAKHLIAAVMR